MAAAVALALLELVPGRAASECDAYEDGERASHRVIGWRDFRAVQRPEGLGGAVAYIATSIAVEPLAFEVNEEVDGTWSARPADVCVRAFMLKGSSGFLSREVVSADLAHEQGHFDLTEIFARALERRLENIRERGASPEAALAASRARSDGVARQVLAEWHGAQRLYDAETECSARAQRRWLRWIAQQLAPQPELIPPRPLPSARWAPSISMGGPP